MALTADAYTFTEQGYRQPSNLTGAYTWGGTLVASLQSSYSVTIPCLITANNATILTLLGAGGGGASAPKS